MYKIHKYSCKINKSSYFIGIFLGFFFLLTANILHFQNLKYKVWIDKYGDYMPHYNPMMIYTIRKPCIFIKLVKYFRYYVHYWNLMTIYIAKKYNPLYLTKDDMKGYDYIMLYDFIVRLSHYEKKRDKSFDFMNIGYIKAKDLKEIDP